MMLLTIQKATSWCEGNQICLKPLIVPHYRVSSSLNLKIVIPEKASKAISFSYSLLAHDEKERFSGGLFGVTEWGIWSEDSEKLGMMIVKRLANIPEGQKNLVEEMPCLFLNENEFLDAQAFILQSFLFNWDAYYVLQGGKSIIEINHDNYVVLHFQRLVDFEKAKRNLSSWV